MDEQERRRRPLALIVIVVLILLAAIAVLVWALTGDERKVEPPMPDGVSSDESTEGERFEYPAFYHAEAGEWIINEPQAGVLREQKYVSGPRELEEYAVVILGPGSRVRIVEADQRWKLVEVIEDGNAIATGWIDASPIRKVREAPAAATKPTGEEAKRRHEELMEQADAARETGNLKRELELLKEAQAILPAEPVGMRIVELEAHVVLPDGTEAQPNSD
jgi:hypothetical protein